MNIFEEMGIIRKDNEKDCNFNGVLFVKAKDSIIQQKFKYKFVNERKYTNEMGVIGEFSAVSIKIFTPFYWLPFCKDAKIRLENGKEYYINGIDEKIDNEKALSGENGLVGLYLYVGG